MARVNRVKTDRRPSRTLHQATPRSAPLPRGMTTRTCKPILLHGPSSVLGKHDERMFQGTVPESWSSVFPEGWVQRRSRERARRTVSGSRVRYRRMRTYHLSGLHVLELSYLEGFRHRYQPPQLPVNVEGRLWSNESGLRPWHACSRSAPPPPPLLNLLQRTNILNLSFIACWRPYTQHTAHCARVSAAAGEMQRDPAFSQSPGQHWTGSRLP